MSITSSLQRIYQAGFLMKMGIRLLARRQLTVKKALNLSLNLLYGFLRIPSTTRFPSIIQIDINNICNLRCPACPTGLREQAIKSGQMDFSFFNQLIEEIKDYTFLIILYNSGEPFLHPDIYKLIQLATSRNIGVMTSSNGHFINSEQMAEDLVRSGLDTIIISISGTSQEIYSKYHVGGDCNTVFKNIKRVAEAKKKLRSKTPKLILRYLAFKHNMNDIKNVNKLSRDLGVDQHHIRFGCEGLIFANDSGPKLSISDSNKDKKEYVKKKDHCYWPWLLPVINWDGTVIPCCHTNLSPPVLGNIYKERTLSEVWTGEKYRKFRKTVLQDKASIPSCKECVSFPGFQDKFNERKDFIIQLSRSRKKSISTT